MRATRALLALYSHQCGTISGSSAIARSMSTKGAINRNDTYLLLCMHGMLGAHRALQPPVSGRGGHVERCTVQLTFSSWLHIFCPSSDNFVPFMGYQQMTATSISP